MYKSVLGAIEAFRLFFYWITKIYGFQGDFENLKNVHSPGWDNIDILQYLQSAISAICNICN